MVTSQHCEDKKRGYERKDKDWHEDSEIQILRNGIQMESTYTMHMKIWIQYQVIHFSVLKSCLTLIFIFLIHIIYICINIGQETVPKKEEEEAEVGIEEEEIEEIEEIQEKDGEEKVGASSVEKKVTKQETVHLKMAAKEEEVGVGIETHTTQEITETDLMTQEKEEEDKEVEEEMTKVLDIGPFLVIGAVLLSATDVVVKEGEIEEETSDEEEVDPIKVADSQMVAEVHQDVQDQDHLVIEVIEMVAKEKIEAKVQVTMETKIMKREKDQTMEALIEEETKQALIEEETKLLDQEIETLVLEEDLPKAIMTEEMIGTLKKRTEIMTTMMIERRVVMSLLTVMIEVILTTILRKMVVMNEMPQIFSEIGHLSSFPFIFLIICILNK